MSSAGFLDTFVDVDLDLMAATDALGLSVVEEDLAVFDLTLTALLSGLDSCFIFCLAISGVSMALNLASRKAAVSTGGWYVSPFEEGGDTISSSSYCGAS